MKHMRPMTKGNAAKANAFQDVLCIVINVVAALFDSFGATSPLLNFTVDKCDPTA